MNDLPSLTTQRERGDTLVQRFLTASLLALAATLITAALVLYV